MESKSDRSNPFYWLAGGVALVGLVLLLDRSMLDGLRSVLRLNQPSLDQCQEIVQSQATLSRAKLSQLLAVPVQTRRDQLLPLLQNPYCRLPSITTPEGITLEREAYPLEFDLSVWLIVLYDRGSYVNYEFSFR